MTDNFSPPLIPYFETSRYKVEIMIELAEVKVGEYAADLGTGDARIAIALAKAGAKVTAYELNDEYFKQAKLNIENAGYNRQITLSQSNFWETNLSEFSLVTIYPMPDIMDKLEKKLLAELQNGSRVLTNYYEFPNWKVKENKNSIFLYKMEY